MSDEDGMRNYLLAFRPHPWVSMMASAARSVGKPAHERSPKQDGLGYHLVVRSPIPLAEAEVAWVHENLQNVADNLMLQRVEAQLTLGVSSSGIFYLGAHGHQIVDACACIEEFFDAVGAPREHEPWPLHCVLGETERQKRLYPVEFQLEHPSPLVLDTLVFFEQCAEDTYRPCHLEEIRLDAFVPRVN